jgi:hypothetical protein
MAKHIYVDDTGASVILGGTSECVPLTLKFRFPPTAFATGGVVLDTGQTAAFWGARYAFLSIKYLHVDSAMYAAFWDATVLFGSGPHLTQSYGPIVPKIFLFEDTTVKFWIPAAENVPKWGTTPLIAFPSVVASLIAQQYADADYETYPLTGGAQESAPTKPLTEMPVINKLYRATEIFTGAVWIDNNSIYRQVFTGTITATDNSPALVVLATDIDKIIKFGGWWGSPGGKFPILTGDTVTGNCGFLNVANNALRFMSRFLQGRIDEPYEIWVEYTKV